VSSRPAAVAFLVDVDNTLLDNDRVTEDLRRYLDRTVGPEGRARYWAHFERLRVELGYADYLGALQRYRLEFPRDPHLLTVSAFLIDYPFANRLYPGSLDVLERFRGCGPTVILSDGDVVFQPRKIQRSGLGDAVDGVLIYVHKERELDDVEQRYPADHYVPHLGEGRVGCPGDHRVPPAGPLRPRSGDPRHHSGRRSHRRAYRRPRRRRPVHAAGARLRRRRRRTG